MIHYRDKTFCPYWEFCKQGDTCHRALTPQVKEDAKAFGLPVATYVQLPACFDAKDSTE